MKNIREKYKQSKKEIRELETQNSQLVASDARVPKNRARIVQLEQENIALITQNPELHFADVHQPIYGRDIEKKMREQAERDKKKNQ